jgi:hypothetical protein
VETALPEAAGELCAFTFWIEKKHDAVLAAAGKDKLRFVQHVTDRKAKAIGR